MTSVRGLPAPLIGAALIAVAGCGRTSLDAGGDLPTDHPRDGSLFPDGSRMDAPPLGPALLRFAVIGDYGIDSAAEARVARMVASWNPDFVITTGDNNYPDGAAATIDANIGKH